MVDDSETDAVDMNDGDLTTGQLRETMAYVFGLPGTLNCPRCGAANEIGHPDTVWCGKNMQCYKCHKYSYYSDFTG